MPNVLTMLKADHATVKKLLRELDETTERSTRQRERLCTEIERELKVHSQLEEEIFYPAFKAAADKKRKDDDLFYEAREEHHVVDLVLPELMSANPKSKEFSAKATVLKELVEHHIREEEKEMFPQARKLFSEAELRALGDQTAERKEELTPSSRRPRTSAARQRREERESPEIR